MSAQEALDRINTAAASRSLELDLRHLQLSVLPAEIGQLTNLTDLGLGGNQLSVLPAEIGQLTNLTDLGLDGNQLSVLPAEIGQLANLTDLGLGGNQLSVLPSEIGQLANLTHLWLDGNQLSVLPAEIGQLTNLTGLRLDGNQLSVLPAEIGQLANLTHLWLDGNQLSVLPAEIGQLTNLTGLRLDGNQLSVLPAEIGQLTNLTGLGLDGNQLSVLPAEIGQLANLTGLGLDGNQLSVLPAEIGQLANLTDLWLGGNQLSVLPAEIGQLANLTDLWLGGNQLSVLPSEIGQLANLTGLWLDGNQLSVLPSEIGQLANLTRLGLDGNQLSVLPPEIGQLTNLTRLGLDGNQLSVLPPEIGQLTNLTRLWLDGNQLSVLPPEIGQLTNLTDLRLYGNLLPDAMPSAADAGIEILRTYLQRLNAEGVPLWEGKLLIVGEGEVGKSALLGALRGDPWQEDRDSTHGLEVLGLNLDHPDRPDVALTLNAWDFAGQTVYRPTHQIFFSGPAVYLVVWKPREGSQQGAVDYWLRMIHLRAPTGSRVLVVATHGGPSDSQAHLDRAGLRDKHGDLIAGFFHVDSKNPDVRIEDLKAAIATETASLPEMGQEFPETFTEIRRAFTPTRNDSDVAPYLRFDRFCEQTADLGDAERRTLIAIASSRGQWIFHGGDSPRADDLIVTRPDWLAKAIAYVLEDQKTAKNDGLLAGSRLPAVWDNPDREEQYPEDLYPIFLSLMDRFDLAYEVRQTADQRAQAGSDLWLVAQLVPAVPSVTLHTHSADHVEVVEFYDRVSDRTETAEGLIFRLMVRMHRYSLGAVDYTKAVHWQRGVALHDAIYGDAVIKVEGDSSLRIEASGPGAQRFVALIVEDVRRMCEEYWTHLAAEMNATCGSACGLGSPGKARFPLDKLLVYKYDEIACTARRCDAELSVAELLGGHRPNSSVRSELQALNKKIDERSDDLLHEFTRNGIALGSLVGDLAALAVFLDTNFETIGRKLDGLGEEQKKLAVDLKTGLNIVLASLDEINGPRLIVPTINKPRGLKTGWQEAEIRLVLYCEHSRQPVWVLNNDQTKGRYTMTIPRDFLNRWLPLAALTTRLLAGFSPIGLFTLEEHLSKDNWDAVKDELKLASDSIDALSTGAGIANSALETEIGFRDPGDGLGNIDRGSIAVLHEFIREQDPGFGGLVPVRDRQTKRRMWVDPQFSDLYFT